MASRGSINPDIQQLQLEAQHRWLRPAEICEILRNHQKFQISTEPPNWPSSGSLFLFDRKVLRYFRKDGHNWRKKKDGKTVKEAYEKLKVGSVDVLHCYYAHGENNECFQRRSYWLLEEEFMHIVFVHYLEVKGNRSSIRETEPLISNSQISNSVSSSVSNSYNKALTGNTGSTSVTSLTSCYEDVESEDNLLAISKYPSPLNFPHVDDSFENHKLGALMSSTFLPTYPEGYKGVQPPGLGYGSIAQQEAVTNDNHFQTLDLASWEEVFQQRTSSSGNLPVNPSAPLAPIVGRIGNFNESFSQLLDGGAGVSSASEGSLGPHLQSNNPLELSSTEFQDNTNISVAEKQPLLGNIRAEEGLQKVDSFSKWMSRELAGVDDLNLKSSSNLSWQNIETATAVDDPSIQLENYSMSPPIGQDQLFDIQEFSPSCASTDSETKVVITGKFLVNPSEVFKYKWSCMFGGVEVPAQVIGNGVLCCYAPLHSAGQVPFYVTCSNRFACSQVREFEYLVESQDADNTNVSGNSITEKQLCLQLQKLLSLGSPGNFDSTSESIRKTEPIFRKILLLMEDELCLGVEQHLKEKVVSWLFDKISEDGKGPNILDEEGQGLLHLAAALGFDWIIPLTITAGVSVNFQDINGWTALHWAAFFGREKTVALLVALEAVSGALTDPSPEFPLGRTAADLASANGFKGISGFLAEHSLTAQLMTLTMIDRQLDSPVEESMSKAVQTMRDKVATPGDEGDGSDLSLKDSLAAVRNATQAAGRIHEDFRMQSFQRKQVSHGASEDESLSSDEQLLSLLSSKIQRPRHHDEHAHSAAIHIQKKYRGWKKRKEFLTIRERVVKIQAHVRGYQVRKRYETVVWSVGILEKVILRWRRKGTGLRGFRPDALNKAPITEVTQQTPSNPSEDDDYDYLKEGRKQTEERLQKALFRVKSMVQYPEGRAQYRRLSTAVGGFQKNQKNAQTGTHLIQSVPYFVVKSQMSKTGLRTTSRWHMLALVFRAIKRLSVIVSPGREVTRLHCCLFPGDYEFEREKLVQLWMAVGFLGEKRMENAGQIKFELLLEEQFILHARIDGLTRRRKYKVNIDKVAAFLDGIGTIEKKDVYFTLEDENATVDGSKFWHLSLLSSYFDQTTFETLKSFKELRTLLFVRNYGSSLKQIPSFMFLVLKSIQALDLSGSHITELPNSLGNVIQLRYLDLSFTLIETLPESIDRLHQLQTLKLEGCKCICILPKGMKELISLRYLDFDVLGQLTFMPKGIGALTELRKLSAFVVDSEEGCSIGELKNMNNLEGSICISNLENAYEHEAREATLSDKKHLTQLLLRWNDFKSYSLSKQDDVYRTIQNLQPNSSLEELQILYYPGFKLPTWVGSTEFEKLVSITFLKCANDKLNVTLGKLPNLKHLSIIHMHRLTKIGRLVHEFYGFFGTSGTFVKLETLIIDGMPNLEAWVGACDGDFPLLSKLVVKQCPKLTVVPFLPYLISLKQLEISHCEMLKSLSDSRALSTSLQTLVINNCPLLKKRCMKGGEDWCKIEHIPDISIDLEDVRSTHADGAITDDLSTGSDSSSDSNSC